MICGSRELKIPRPKRWFTESAPTFTAPFGIWSLMFLWDLELGIWDLFQSVHIILGLGVAYEFCGIGAIQIFFEIGVAVAIEVLGGIGRVIRIEAVFFLPFIRHAVVIAVDRRGSGFVFRPAANVIRRHDDPILAK